MMDAIVFAAGLGTRLRPLTNTMPKPLVPVAGKGTLIRLLEALPDTIDRVVLVTHHLEERIREAVGLVFAGRPIAYVHQDPLDGTGGALRQAASFIRSERFLAINGDDMYRRQDLERLVVAERGVLVRRETLTQSRDAWMVESGRLRDLQITPAGVEADVNVGAYLLGPEWFTTTPTLVPGKTNEWSLPHALPQVLATYAYRAVPATFWFPCGTPEEIREAEVALRRDGRA